MHHEVYSVSLSFLCNPYIPFQIYEIFYLLVIYGRRCTTRSRSPNYMPRQIMHSDWCFASNQNTPIFPDHRGFYIPEVILHVHIKATRSGRFSVVQQRGCGRTELRRCVSRLWSYRTSSACLSVVVVQNFVRVSLGRGPERYQRVSRSWSRTLSACLSVVIVQNVISNFISVSLCRGCPELPYRWTRKLKGELKRGPR